MAARNADSMNNNQGEFNPHKPRSEPLTTKGHQVGQQVGNADAPEFHVKTLPAGTAPASSTFQPNPISEIPGQANNPDASDTALAASDFPGATSADVHTGLGHPGSGQTGSGLHNDGKSHREKQKLGLQGQAEGGSGLRGDGELNDEAEKLLKDHEGGAKAGKEHNISLDGAETKANVGAEEVAAMGQENRKRDYDRTTEAPPGKNS